MRKLIKNTPPISSTHTQLSNITLCSSILSESRRLPRCLKDLSLVTAFFFLIAGVLVTLGGEAIVHSRHYRKGSLIAAIGFGSFLFGWYWNALRSRLGVRFVTLLESMASDARIWLALIASIILYGMATNLIAAIKRNNLESIVKEDIPALHAAVKAFVLPRSLSVRQVAAIAATLSSYPPYKVSAQVQERDTEASTFWADLQRAIERGGWSVVTIDHVKELPEGLMIESHETIRSAQIPHGPHNPKPYELLTQALNEAAITFDQTRSTGIDDKVNVLTIKVGKRRRDALQPHLNPDRFLS